MSHTGLSEAETRIATGAAPLTDALDELIQRYGSDEHVDDIARARAEFDDRRGRVFEDEELWEAWTRAFLEWFVTERALPGKDYPPAVQALMEEADPSRADCFRALARSHRSVFEVRALHEARVELIDLIGGASFLVEEQRALHGVSAGDVAELRLIGFGDDLVFGRTFCFHPAGTREAIVAHGRRILGDGGNRRDVIDFCASLRIRCERYRHVTATRVYEVGTIDFGRERTGDRA